MSSSNTENPFLYEPFGDLHDMADRIEVAFRRVSLTNGLERHSDIHQRWWTCLFAVMSRQRVFLHFPKKILQRPVHSSKYLDYSLLVGIFHSYFSNPHLLRRCYLRQPQYMEHVPIHGDNRKSCFQRLKGLLALKYDCGNSVGYCQGSKAN